jgi:hypothetical protein
MIGPAQTGDVPYSHAAASPARSRSFRALDILRDPFAGFPASSAAGVGLLGPAHLPGFNK